MKKLLLPSIALFTSALLFGCSDYVVNNQTLTNPKKQTSWKFAVLTDSQGARQSFVNGNLSLPKGAPTILMEAANRKLIEEEVDFALFTGDLTELATSVEYRSWLDAFGPFLKSGGHIYPVRGNHEFPNWRFTKLGKMAMPLKYQETLETWKTFMGPLLPKENCLNPERCLSYSFTKNNTLFIALDTYFHYDKPGRWDEYKLGMPEWKELTPWIKSTFDKYADKTDQVIVFLHEPLFGRSYDKTGQINHGWRYIDALDNNIDDVHQTLSELFTSHKVTVFSGHDHQYSRSQVYPFGTDVDKSFTNISSGNMSYKSYSNKAGYYSDFEKPVSQDNFNPKQAEYPGIENAMTMIIVEVNDQHVHYRYLRANHSFKHEDSASGKQWENPNWQLVDEFKQSLNADSKMVAANDKYSLSSKAPLPYQDTHVEIIDGVNNTFDTVEAIGIEYDNPVTGVKLSTEKGAHKHLFKQISISWLTPEAETQSPVFVIDGFAQQDCTLSRYWGAAEKNPHCNKNSHGNSNHVIDQQQTDRYVIRITAVKPLPAATLAVRAPQKWKPILNPACKVTGQYKPEYLHNTPTSLSAECSKGVWGINEQNQLWAILNQQGQFALMSQNQ